jgi:hypothetical protein
METDDGALILPDVFGLRHGPPEVLAALARGESVDPPSTTFGRPQGSKPARHSIAFLNQLIAVSSGDRARASGPIYTIEEISSDPAAMTSRH